MLQSKHLLSFGSEQKTSALQAQGGWDSKLRGKGLKNPGPDFALFLSGGAPASPGMPTMTGMAGMPGAGKPADAHELASKAVLGSPFEAMGMNASTLAASKQRHSSPMLNSKTLMSGEAANHSNAALRMSAAQDVTPNSDLPGIISSRKSARTRSQSAMLNNGTEISAHKRNERISGRPITGRNDIGMVDTRKTQGMLTNATPSRSGVRAADSGTGSMAYGLRDFSEFTAPKLMKGIGGINGLEGITGTNTLALHNGKNSTIYVNINDTANLQRSLQQAANPIKTAASAKSIQFLGGEEGAAMSVKVSKHKADTFSQTPLIQDWDRGFISKTFSNPQGEIGTLAAKFESGGEGVAAIGYDRHGGTSYGKYQLSSRAGTMTKFISYLEDHAPDMAQKLSAAGPANTGKRTGKMPEVWRGIAAAEPERFERLQNDFIKLSHFQPALEGIAQKTGLEFDKMPTALQEVLFSTAVQHGPTGATRIFSRAVERVGSKIEQLADATADGFKKAGEALIKQVYAIREGQFVSSTARVQAAAKSRLRIEMKEALNMLS